MVATHTQSKKKHEIIKVNTRTLAREHTHTHTHTQRNYIDIRRELYTQQTYCQMHYICYCTANIHQIWKQWKQL